MIISRSVFFKLQGIARKGEDWQVQNLLLKVLGEEFGDFDRKGPYNTPFLLISQLNYARKINWKMKPNKQANNNSNKNLTSKKDAHYMFTLIKLIQKQEPGF